MTHNYEECWFENVSAAALRVVSACAHAPRTFVCVGARELCVCSHVFMHVLYVRLSGTGTRPPLEHHALMDVNVD